MKTKSFPTVSYRVLLEEIRHVYVDDSFLLLHEIVAMRDFTASRTAWGQNLGSLSRFKGDAFTQPHLGA